MDIKAIVGFIRGHKKIIIVSAAAALALYFILSGPKQKVFNKEQAAKGAGNITTEERLKAEIEGLKKSLEEMKKQQEQQGKKEEEQKKAKEASPKGQETTQSLKELEKILKPGQPPSYGGEPKHKEPETQVEIEMPTQKPLPPRITKIDISEAAVPEKDKRAPAEKADLFLPASSFASFTLTSGAYAPETGEQMPVSAVIDKAFIGPNKSSIPLRGCFLLGKARGMTGEKCADIKVVKISCVWPDGNSFESDIAGYVTAQNGDFCLPGRVERHSSDFFATVGITSFIEGLTVGMSKAQESTTLESSNGAVQSATNIVGSATKYGLLKGAADFAAAAKQFFGSQLQSLVPAVVISAGTRGYLFLTSGVKITGGKNAISTGASYYDTYNLSRSK